MKVSQEVGKDFEDVIEARADNLGGCVIFKQYPEVHFPRGNPKVSKNGGAPDYIMFLRGKAYLFDAKSTGNLKSLQAPSDRKSQFEDMKRAASCGITSGYLVQWRVHEEIEFFEVTVDEIWPFRMHRKDGTSSVIRKLFGDVDGT